MILYSSELSRNHMKGRLNQIPIESCAAIWQSFPTFHPPRERVTCSGLLPSVPHYTSNYSSLKEYDLAACAR